jgi:cephalosporin-C deacetylase
MLLDLPESQLHEYRSSQVDPPDFDEFWSETLQAGRRHPLALEVQKVDAGLATLDVYDVTFAGYAGERIKAWLRVPAGTTAALPTVVQFHGYGRGRGEAIENLLWASAGYAHLELDTRGQAWSGSRGSTPDLTGSGPQVPGFLTRGIDSRESYYYRRLILDAVRLVDAAAELPVTDASRVMVTGVSQGGGLALAVAGLVPGLRAVAARVPFLCDFPRAIMITDSDPYKEIANYLSWYRGRAAAVLHTLSYFDGVNFIKRATAPVWLSAALMDPICPPSTVFGAYNAYPGPKEISVWPYNGHEGGGVDDDLAVLDIARRTIAAEAR